MDKEYLNLKSTITMNSIKAETQDGDFILYDATASPTYVPLFKTSEYGCFICLDGESSGNIDLASCRLTPSSMLISVPGQLFEHKSRSSDFRGMGIIMSTEFVKSLGLPYNFNLDKMLRGAPVFKLKPSKLEAMMSYMTMVRRLLEKERPFQRETLQHLTCAFFFGIGSYLFQISKIRKYSNEEKIMQRFLHEIKTNYHNERKVSFYANSLCLSASYFSSVIKKVSGKAPGFWIDEYVTGEACAMLKGTRLTVQQISHELGFPSQSFFGKYFKRQTGMSPKEYREE